MLSKILLAKKNKPINFLTKTLKKNSGRNNLGQITVRGKIFGFTKKKYRIIDFSRFLWNILGVVSRVEYDPYRRCSLALISYTSGHLAYILAVDSLIPGDFIIAGDWVPLKPGNATYLKNIPTSLKIHNIESSPFSGSIFLRAAGCFGTVVERSENFCLVKFNSGILKKFSIYCMATIGTVSNLKFKYLKLKKAGHNILRGKRQKVRGVAMNATDHPHGGGKGKKSPNSLNSSPWKKLGKNIKTVKRLKNNA